MIKNTRRLATVAIAGAMLGACAGPTLVRGEGTSTTTDARAASTASATTSTVSSANSAKPKSASTNAAPAANSSDPAADSTEAGRPVADPAAPKLQKVKRPGKGNVSVAGVTVDGDFANATLKYSDGLTLKVTKVERGKVTGQGAGVIAGQPMTTITLRVTNDSQTKLDATRTVAQLTYGNPALLARPVYDQNMRDLATVVEPGQSVTATYAFAVPDGGLKDATFSLDIDGQHGLAVLHGRLG